MTKSRKGQRLRQIGKKSRKPATEGKSCSAQQAYQFPDLFLRGTHISSGKLDEHLTMLLNIFAHLQLKHLTAGEGRCLTIHKLGHCTETARAFAVLEQKVCRKSVVNDHFCKKHRRRCPWELVSEHSRGSQQQIPQRVKNSSQKKKEHEGRRRTPRNYVQ